MGLRDVLVHRYFDIDADLVWRVVENDLPGLEREVTAALQRLQGVK